MASESNIQTRSRIEIPRLDQRFVEEARGHKAKRIFRVPNKLMEVPQNLQLSAKVAHLPLDMLMLIFDELEEYDQIVLLLTCKVLLRASAYLKLDYNPPEFRMSAADLPEITPVPRHDTAQFAEFLARIRTVKSDGSVDFSWRPCIDCLRYRPVNEAPWITAAFPRPCINDQPFRSECKENAIIEWCHQDSLSCPTCLTKNFQRMDEVVSHPETGEHVVKSCPGVFDLPELSEIKL